jgi:hypothetical protein
LAVRDSANVENYGPGDGKLDTGHGQPKANVEFSVAGTGKLDIGLKRDGQC